MVGLSLLCILTGYECVVGESVAVGPRAVCCVWVGYVGGSVVHASIFVVGCAGLRSVVVVCVVLWGLLLGLARFVVSGVPHVLWFSPCAGTVVGRVSGAVGGLAGVCVCGG